MPTTIYANGVKATAIAGIKARIALYTTTLADGSRSFNTQAMQEWLYDQGALLVNGLPAEYSSRDGATAQLSVTDTRADTLAYERVVDKSHWTSHPAWPASTVLGSSSYLAAVIEGQAALRTASFNVGAVFRAVESGLDALVEGYFNSFGTAATLPPTTTRILDSRFYIITYVTDRGEESAPSPPSVLATVDQNDVVNVNLVTPPVGRFINRWRIYRSNQGSTGAAFQFVEELPIATPTYADAKKGSELNEVCPTLTWAEPPYRLRGLVALPNGVLAGFFDNTVCFSEAFVPYAWPVEYQLTTAAPITGMAVFGQTLVVGTHGGVDYISGSDAASMSQQADVSLQACASANSMVAVEGGVVYASPDGLCLANGAGVQLLTMDHFTRADWQLRVPEFMFCAYHEGTVYIYGGAIEGASAFHLETKKLTALEATASAVYVDQLTDQIYIASGNTISAVFASPAPRTALWRSKLAVQPRQTGFAWLAVESDFSAPVLVRWYGDGVLRHTASVSSRIPVRLPAGCYLEHEVEIESSARVTRVTLTSSTAELQSV